MVYLDLREFVGRLEKERELRPVRAEEDPVLEITKVVQRICRPSAQGEEKGVSFLTSTAAEIIRRIRLPAWQICRWLVPAQCGESSRATS